MRLEGLSAAVVLACAATPVAGRGEPNPFFDDLSGVVTVGPAIGSGETSWTQGGLGKLQTDDRAQIAASAILVWRGQFGPRLGAVVSTDLQSLGDPSAGLDEAYVTLRPAPGAVRMSARAGLFFPPASLEHDGSEWSVVRTLTPSAINSWLAEEVKVAGVEATVRTDVAGRPVGLTAAAFQGDDTSGALLFFRGWALHDLRSNLGGSFKLPPTPNQFLGKQNQSTRPVDEVDGRWGAYARLDYAPSQTLALNAFVYGNNGDRTSVVQGQYAWRTRFVQVSARWTPFDDVEVLAQTVTGETAMGAAVNGLDPADVGFAATYLLVTRRFARGSGTVRIDQFSVSDRTFKAIDNNAERGWAATVVWSAPISQRSELIAETIFASSERPDRLRLGAAADQDSLQVRTAFRTAF